MKIRFPIPLAAILVTASALVACGDDAADSNAREQRLEDYAAKYGANVDVEISDDGQETIAIHQNAGGGHARVGKNLEPPTGFPSDIPIYPDLNISSATKVGAGYSIQGQSGDATDKLAEFYLRGMAEEGWIKAIDTAPSPSIRSFGFTKDRRTASISLIVNEQSEETTVQISTTAEAG